MMFRLLRLLYIENGSHWPEHHRRVDREREKLKSKFTSNSLFFITMRTHLTIYSPKNLYNGVFSHPLPGKRYFAAFYFMVYQQAGMPMIFRSPPFNIPFTQRRSSSFDVPLFWRQSCGNITHHPFSSRSTSFVAIAQSKPRWRTSCTCSRCWPLTSWRSAWWPKWIPVIR